MIILDDVDVDYAVRTARSARSFTRVRSASTRGESSGNARIAGEFLESSSRARRRCRRATRSTTRPSSDPSSRGPPWKLVDERVKEAVAKARRFMRAAASKADSTSRRSQQRSLDCALANEETFGPSWCGGGGHREQAVDAANRTLYGLTSSILSGNTYRAFELARSVLAGHRQRELSDGERRDPRPVGRMRDQRLGRTAPTA